MDNRSGFDSWVRLCLLAVSLPVLVSVPAFSEAWADGDPFVTTWEITRPGESITVPTYIAFEPHTIDWGDGTPPTTSWMDQIHTYEQPGNYTVSITGDFTEILLDEDRSNAKKLVSIDSWGDMEWATMNRAFSNAINMVYNASDVPDLSSLTDLQYMFYHAASFNGDLSDWDVSSVTNMKDMFAHAASFNGDLSDWDVSSVQNMHGMFYKAASFNGDLSDWDVSSVTDMDGMFAYANSFNGDLSDWDVSSVADMSLMFFGANSFNGDLSDWDVSSVADMTDMFDEARSFDQNLGNWYIVLTDTAVDYEDAPGIVGSISAQNSFLDGQNPAYGIGSGGDSGSFEIVNGSSLRLKEIPTKSSYTVTITSTGEFGSNNSRTFDIGVSGLGNSPPTVSAGDDQTVTEGNTVTLAGTASDDDAGDALTYAWTHDSALDVTLANDTALSTTFTAPAVGSDTAVTFTLAVSDGTNAAVTDRVTVTITDNAPPSADAGANQTVQEGATVTLSGTATDADDDALTYLWTHDSALDVTLANDTALSTTFTAPAVGSDTAVTFTLAVSDGTNAAVTDRVTVTITDNAPPSADAGANQTVQEGATVTLSGTATDADDDALTYLWTHDSALDVTLANDTALSTTFTAPAVGSDTAVTFTLAVSDGTNAAVTDRVTVTITDNAPPSADAGANQTVQEGATVTLSGTATDADDDALTYLWTHDSALDVTLANDTALSTTFTAPAVGSDTAVTFTLAVSDGTNAAVTDRVTVTITDNAPPSADAGANQTVQEGATVTLSGTATDADDDALTYLWTHDSALDVTLANDTALSTTFTAPAVGSDTAVTFTLAVSDGTNAAVTDRVTVTITDSSVTIETPEPTVDTRDLDSVVLTSPRPGTIQVTWEALGDTPVNYRLTWAKVGERFPARSASDGNAFLTSTTHTITGLEEGEWYKVKARARYNDGDGHGAWSDVARINVTSSVGGTLTSSVPDSPLNPRVYPASNETLSVSWRAPSYDGGDAITGYKVQWKESAGNWTVSGDVSEATVNGTVHTITGLANGTTYAVQVIATNGMGDSEPSTEATAATQTSEPDRGGREIGMVILTSTQSGTIEAVWEAPGKAPVDYRMAWAKVGENFPIRSNPDGNAFPADPSQTLTDLEEGEQYKVKVRARYHDGDPGIWSTVTAITVADTR